MVAFAGDEPIGVLIGAKRAGATLVHRIAVHPDHRRQGHGRHLLTSLASKLAILGPPRMVAEVPETLHAAVALFRACGYGEEARLTSYESNAECARDDQASMLVIPVTVDDLEANGLLTSTPHGGAPTCWERSVETLAARKSEIEGLAVASDERLEAVTLYSNDGEILSLRLLVDADGGRLARLLCLLRAQGREALRFPKVHPAEISPQQLHALGFHSVGSHLVFAARAQSH